MQTIRVRLGILLAAALFVMASGAAAGQGSDLFFGTWKLNVAKSTYSPGPPPMSVTRVVETWETDGIRETATVVQADGTQVTGGATFHFDGKDYKSANPNFDTTAFKRENANTFSFTMKRAGKVVGTGKYVVAKNGKVGTETVTYVNRKDQKVHNVTFTTSNEATVLM
jgi:hypothetical protein